MTAHDDTQRRRQRTRPAARPTADRAGAAVRRWRTPSSQATYAELSEVGYAPSASSPSRRARAPARPASTGAGRPSRRWCWTRCASGCRPPSSAASSRIWDDSVTTADALREIARSHRGRAQQPGRAGRCAPSSARRSATRTGPGDRRPVPGAAPRGPARPAAAGRRARRGAARGRHARWSPTCCRPC